MPDPAADASQEHAALASTVEEIDDALLGGTRRYSARDLADRADMPLEFVSTFWSTLGLPHLDPDDEYFSENDADAVGRAASLVRDHGLDLRTVLTVTRALGHTSDRLALSGTGQRGSPPVTACAAWKASTTPAGPPSRASSTCDAITRASSRSWYGTMTLSRMTS